MPRASSKRNIQEVKKKLDLPNILSFIEIKKESNYPNLQEYDFDSYTKRNDPNLEV